jgi:hypothetical protein
MIVLEVVDIRWTWLRSIEYDMAEYERRIKVIVNSGCE